MIDKEVLKGGLSKTSDRLIKVAAVVGAITVIAGGYTWYLNNFWKPKVVIDSVDFVNGIAKLRLGDKEITLEGDSSYLIYGDWGVRFGIRYIDGKLNYDRLELTKKGLVYEYINR